VELKTSALLLKNRDGDIRAHFRTQFAAGAKLRAGKNRHGKSQAIRGITQGNQRFRTGDGTETAPFAARFINYDMRHCLYILC
jgi:hypothetical protein